MPQKIKCVLIDDSETVLRDLEIFCQDYPFIEIIGKYSNPNKFLEEKMSFEFDLCILDIDMPGINGIQLAKHLTNKMVIFYTGKEDEITNAIDVIPLGVVKKTNIDKLVPYFERALKLKEEKKQRFFKTDKGNINLNLADILLVESEDSGKKKGIKKKLVMRNGEIYRLRGEHNFDELLEKIPCLIQIKKDTCISEEIVRGREAFDCITIKPEYTEVLKLKSVTLTLSDKYQEEFKKRFPDF